MNYLNKEKLILIIIIFLLVGFFIGFLIGSVVAFESCAKIGMYFLEIKGIDIGLNEDMIKTAMYQYQNHIGGCLFTDQNASISFNKGN